MGNYASYYPTARSRMPRCFHGRKIHSTYSVEEDRWEMFPPTIQPHALGCHGVFMEGKFIVLRKDKSA